MARGLKLWLTVVVLGSAAAFGALRIWIDAVDGILPRGTSRDSLSIVHDSLTREAGATATAIQRIRWSRALGDTTDSLVVIGPDLPAVDSFRLEVRTALAALAALEPRVPVAVALVTRRWQRPDDGTRYIAYQESHGIDYLLPEGGPCQVVVFVPGGPTTPSMLRSYFPTDRLLGPCAWVARYGPPSDSVRAWIQWVGGRFAGSLEPSRPAEHRAALRAAEARGRRWQYGLTGLEQVCAWGVTAACAQLMRPEGLPLYLSLQAQDVDVPEGLILHDLDRSGSSFWAFRNLGAHILADIEAEIGRERFAAFWRTNRPARDALSDALGRPVGEWVADWATARYPGTRQAGVSAVDALLTLLAVAALAGIALFTGARGRRILPTADE